MSLRKTVLGLCWAAMISLALAPFARAGPAGGEYLPKVPQAGGSASTASGGGGVGETSTLPQGAASGVSQDAKGNGNDKKTNDATNKSNGSAKRSRSAGTSRSGGGGDDSSGSILLNPIVLLMIAAVITAAVGGMTLRRRQIRNDQLESHRDPGSPNASSPRTP